MKLLKAMSCARALFSFAWVPARRRSSAWLGGLRRAGNSFPVLPTTRRRSSHFPLSTASRDLTMGEAQEVESGRPLAVTLDVLGAPVRVVASPALSDSEFRKAVDCLVFKNWLRNLHGEKGILATEGFSLREVLIQGVDMFGRSVGFLKFKAEIIDNKTGKMIPGIVFGRGQAVAVLILLESEGELFVVLIEQAEISLCGCTRDQEEARIASNHHQSCLRSVCLSKKFHQAIQKKATTYWEERRRRCPGGVNQCWAVGAMGILSMVFINILTHSDWLHVVHRLKPQQP